MMLIGWAIHYPLGGHSWSDYLVLAGTGKLAVSISGTKLPIKYK
jgi:hypothetical protein